MADPAELQQPASLPADRHTASEQPNGALVSDALHHAARLLVPLRV